MTWLTKFLKSHAQVTQTLLVIYVVSVLVSAFAQSAVLAAISIFLSGILPIALFVLWISSLKPIKEITVLLYIRALIWLAVFVYGVLAHKWASDVVNEMFKVDPSLFGSSTVFLAAVYGPIGVLYKPAITVIQVAELLFFFAIPFFALFLFDSTVRKNLTVKKIVAAAIVALSVVFIVPMTGLILKNFNRVTESLALWADFNEKHRCVNPELKRAKSVVFLSDTNVLAYFPSEIYEDRYQVVPCLYKQISNPEANTNAAQ